MALDFGMLQPANIGGNIMAGRQEAQRNQLAQQQLATGGLQQQKAELELGDFRRRQAGLDSFIQKSRAAKKSGSEEDMLNSYEEYGLEVGDPQHIMNAQELRLAFNERKAHMGGGQQPQPVTAAPAAVADFPAYDRTGDSLLARQAALEAPVTARAPFVETRNLSARGEALPPATPVDNNLIPATAAPVESVNQLGAPAARSPADIQARIIYLNQFPRVPAAKAEIAMLTKELEESRKLYTVGGNLVTGTGTKIFEAPEKVTQTDLRKNFEFAKTPEGGNYTGSFADFKAISTPKTTNVFGVQEKSFEGGLGKGQSDRILANQVVAQDAAAILETNQVGRELLKSGAITGTGADFFVGFNNALKQAGIDFGYADAAANSQAYAAAMGANVGRIIKQFGAGTGLSDADRDYAAQMAGGKINLTEAALRKILDINDKAANRVIDLHNRNVSGIKTNIPLTVDKPTFTQQKSAVDQIPGQSRSAPAPASNSVTLPDGRVKTFPNAAAADQFKKAAGIK